MPLLDDDINRSKHGLAVGVYTTQSATRKTNLYNMYGLAAETAESWSDRPANIGLVSTFAGANEIEHLDH